MVPSLIVINAHGASLRGQTPTLAGVSPNTIIFADRPVRAAGHLLTQHLLEEWTLGSFAKDPPNAGVSVLSRDGASVHDAVVELRDPHLDGDRLTYTVRVLEGDLAGADGPASVFGHAADAAFVCRGRPAIGAACLLVRRCRRSRAAALPLRALLSPAIRLIPTLRERGRPKTRLTALREEGKGCGLSANHW
jgi:hypothetical protein